MSLYPVSSTADALTINGEEGERSSRLQDEIRQLIRTSGINAISFARFMESALYHPVDGYYTSATQVLGREGDFTTAPELGAVFGNFLSAKIARILNSSLIPARIYEFGAGSGKLCVQVLSELNRLGCEIDDYVIFEISPRLKKIQQQFVAKQSPEISTKVHWSDFPAGKRMQGVAIANEVIDAMPVELIRFVEGRVHQGYVTELGDTLRLKFRTILEEQFEQTCNQISWPKFEGTYTSEIHYRAEAWLEKVGKYFEVGSMLISDYGFPQHEYYHPDRNQGTLMCHRRHHSLHDPLEFIGCQDITAHVNFSSLARVAETVGLEVNGFTTLAGFIVDTGLESLDLASLQVSEQMSVTQQLNTLTSPSEMGELFKVMELSKNIEPDRLGFETLDHMHRL